MSLEAIDKRFVDEVKLRAYDDKYIDKIEEREILQIAIQQGIAIESARAALAQVCEREGYVQEATLLKLIKERAEAITGKIDQREFESILQVARQAALGRRTERDLKKMIVLVLEDAGLNRMKTGWFTDWYGAMKRDLGMA
jgi:hypothetical protein